MSDTEDRLSMAQQANVAADIQRQRGIMAGESPPRGLLVQAPTLTPEAQAVLEDAIAFIEAEPQGRMNAECATSLLKLIGSVGAYRATLPPKDYAPEELEPGTRFRFVNRFAGCVCRKVSRAEGGHMEGGWYAEDDRYQVFAFTASDRLIPLPDQDA